jgi:hypothetical protein
MVSSRDVSLRAMVAWGVARLAKVTNTWHIISTDEDTGLLMQDTQRLYTSASELCINYSMG